MISPLCAVRRRTGSATAAWAAPSTSPRGTRTDCPGDPHGQGRFFFRSGDHTTGTALDGAGVSGTYSLLAGADYTDFGEIRSGGGDKEPFSSFERANWRARLSLLPQKSPLIVTGTYLGHFSNNLPRTDQLGLGRIATTDISDNLVYVSLDWRPQAALEKLGIKASYHQVTENATQDVCPVVGGADRIDMASCSSLQTAISAHGYRDVIDTFGLYADFGVRLLKERIRIGGSIEYYYDTIMSTRTELRTLNDVNELIEQTRGVYSSGSYYSRFGTDLHMDAVLATTRIGNLKAHLGGRVSHFAGYAPVVPERNEDIHYTHGGLVDSAGIQWLYRDNFNLYGLFSQGFRSPGLQETTALG